MISFQNFSFRYEESKDFTLRGIDMTVQTGEFILLTGQRLRQNNPDPLAQWSDSALLSRRNPRGSAHGRSFAAGNEAV